MAMEKIRLTKDKETYLATLYGKALDAAARNPILGDRFAAEAVARIDHDFSKLKLPKGADVTLPVRALHFDRWTRAFLAEHAEATVLHLGCGLDTRVYRIDPGPRVRWVDVDFPDVIALREQLYPAREGYRMIGSSVTDPGWLETVPADAPVLVVAEGLLMYVPEKDGTALLRRITERFPGGQVAFDSYTAGMLRMVSRLATVRGAKVELVWGMDDPRELESLVPRLRLVESVSFLTMPEVVDRLSRGPVSRAIHRLVGRLSLYQNLVRHLRYEFPREAAKAAA